VNPETSSKMLIYKDLLTVEEGYRLFCNKMVERQFLNVRNFIDFSEPFESGIFRSNHVNAWTAGTRIYVGCP